MLLVARQLDAPRLVQPGLRLLQPPQAKPVLDRLQSSLVVHQLLALNLFPLGPHATLDQARRIQTGVSSICPHAHLLTPQAHAERHVLDAKPGHALVQRLAFPKALDLLQQLPVRGDVEVLAVLPRLHALELLHQRIEGFLIYLNRVRAVLCRRPGLVGDSDVVPIRLHARCNRLRPVLVKAKPANGVRRPDQPQVVGHRLVRRTLRVQPRDLNAVVRTQLLQHARHFHLHDVAEFAPRVLHVVNAHLRQRCDALAKALRVATRQLQLAEPREHLLGVRTCTAGRTEEPVALGQVASRYAPTNRSEDTEPHEGVREDVDGRVGHGIAAVRLLHLVRK